MIHEPPPNAQVILAQQAIRDNDLVALHEALTSCKGAWFSRGVYLLHYAASNGASAECIDTLVTRAVVGGMLDISPHSFILSFSLLSLSAMQ